MKTETKTIAEMVDSFLDDAPPEKSKSVELNSDELQTILHFLKSWNPDTPRDAYIQTKLIEKLTLAGM